MSNAHYTYEQIRTRRAELAQRRAAIAEQQDALRRELADVDKEDGDWAVAERMVTRLLPEPEQTQIGAVTTAILANLEPKRDQERTKRKPDGIPSIISMARDVLRESTARGKPWLEASDIVRQITERWWPEARAEFIMPQLWRASAKQGVLVKQGNRYALPHAIERGPADYSAEPPQVNGAAGSYPA